MQSLPGWKQCLHRNFSKCSYFDYLCCILAAVGPTANEWDFPSYQLSLARSYASPRLIRTDIYLAFPADGDANELALRGEMAKKSWGVIWG
jgi:hypothetical protein